MAKNTTRDRVWAAAIEVGRNEALGSSSSWRRGFDHEDVREAMDDPPSDKTIRETLQSMASEEIGYPVLEKARRRAQYELRLEDLFRDDQDAEEIEEEPTATTGGRHTHTAHSRPAGQADPTPSESPTQAVEPTQHDQGRPHDPDGAEESAEAEAFGSVGELVGEEEPDGPTVETVDLPGSGDVEETRRATLRQARNYIQQQGEAKASDIQNHVFESFDHGYGSERSMWKNFLQPALGEVGEVELADAHDGVWKPA